MTDGSWSPGLRARQGRDRLSFSQSCLCLPGSEVTQAWLRQEAGLLPSHWESRPTMLLCATPLAVFGDLRFTLVSLSFCQIIQKSQRKGCLHGAYLEVVFVLVAWLGWLGTRGALSSLVASQSCQVQCPTARTQAVSSCLRSRLCRPPGTGSGRMMTFLILQSCADPRAWPPGFKFCPSGCPPVSSSCITVTLSSCHLFLNLAGLLECLLCARLCPRH